MGRVLPGGGWRAHGRGRARSRGTKQRPRVGYSYLHVAVDDHSRLALRRGARQRDRRHPRRVLRPGKAVVPKHRRRRRRGHHRQRAQLPIQKVRRPARRPRHRPHLLSPVPAPDQRQSRALQPHPRRRIPLQLQVQIRTRPPAPTQPLDPRLQSPPPTHRHRRHTLIARTQPLWGLHQVDGKISPAVRTHASGHATAESHAPIKRHRRAGSPAGRHSPRKPPPNRRGMFCSAIPAGAATQKNDTHLVDTVSILSAASAEEMQRVNETAQSG